MCKGVKILCKNKDKAKVKVKVEVKVKDKCKIHTIIIKIRNIEIYLIGK